MYVRLYTIIKSKARKRGSKKMQEASFNNLNKQRVKHTFFLFAKKCAQKIVLYSSVEIYIKRSSMEDYESTAVAVKF